MSDIQSLTDEELVIEIRTKSKERYADIVNRYQDKLMRYAVYLVHDEQKALDVVQESFIKAYINLNGFDAKKKFSSWIYRIVHNEAINSVKKLQKETSLVDTLEIPSKEDIEEDFSKQEIINHAHHCLNLMSSLYSEPLTLFYLEDKTYEEISDILRIPMGTVATRINRAKGIMKIVCKKNT